MGIKQFWDLAGEAGVKVSLAQWASDHLKEKGRPLRIAVDEAHWRYKNIPEKRVAQIKRDNPGSLPREKQILERILPLQRLGIHLLFVFDGDGRPSYKRSHKRGGQLETTTADLKTTLDHIRVPWYQAPGEAEAECALLQQKGLVDAVWSEDGDTFMFGCTVLIRNRRDAKGAKLKEDAELFEFEKLCKLQKGLDSKESIALLGMLVGFDYVRGGLKGCGISLAQHLTKKEALVDEFSHIRTEEQATRWRKSLEASIDDILQDKVLGRSLHFDKGKSNIKKFPDLEALRTCLSPVVSGSDALERLPFLQGEWCRMHTTETLRTSIPWMSQHYYSKLDAAGWVQIFIPMVVNQKLLKGKVGSRDLFAKFAKKNKEAPTTPVKLDPRKAFPGIENIFVGSECAIENVKFELLDAILEFEARKEPPTRSRARATPLVSFAAKFLSVTDLFLAIGDAFSDTCILTCGALEVKGDTEDISRDFLKLRPQILTKYNQKQPPAKKVQGKNRVRLVGNHTAPTTTSPSGRSRLSQTATNATPASPVDLAKKKSTSLDAGQSSKETLGDTRSPSSGLRHGSTYTLDGENSHEESVSTKKRKLQDPIVEDVLAEIPGMKARRMILEMATYSSQESARSVPEFEMYSSQNSIWATEAIGEKPCKEAVEESVTGAGGGTIEDPFII